MKKIILAISLVLVFNSIAHADIRLTKEQFENLSILTEKIKKNYPDFIGFSGSKNNMKVIGISDDVAIAEIAKVDLTAELKSIDDAKKAKVNAVLDKFKAKGIDITEDDMSLMVDASREKKAKVGK